MSRTFSEFYEGNTGLTVGVKQMLFTGKSPYQKVEVIETDAWGVMLLLDGMVMLSEKDEFVYHEMIAHPALCSHPGPERVLIIGGGDGGTAREVLRHGSVSHIDMVEIDEMVIEVCQKWLPEVNRFDDNHLHIHIEDGIAFLKNNSEPYDIIIIDGSDPVGPAKALFSDNFIQLCTSNLRERGILVMQSESPWVNAYKPVIASLHRSLSTLFAEVHPYLCYIPLYPAGMWSMMMASKQVNPLAEPVSKRVNEWYTSHQKKLKYYNPEIHKASFALPEFVTKIFEHTD